MVVLWTSEPEVPVTVTEKVPVAAAAEAVKVRVELALPPEGGVTDAGENEAVTPPGRPDALRPTAELNPLRLETVMVLAPVPPWVTLTDEGEAETAKSGTGTPVTVSDMLKERSSVPSVPWAWKL
jgi:hypothetical protein